jgi:dTDP-4-dehydrorhamnose reductase
MRVLITGANGILGRALSERLGGAHTLYLWGRGEADLTDEAQVRAAGKTNVDGCESEPERAMAANRDATRFVAALARERGAAMVYVSTDYVFDGSKGSPYMEEDPTHPINEYGRTKLAGEEAARASGAACLVVRTSWLYGPGGKNFVETIAAKLGRGESLEVVDDQRGSPTYARDLASAIELLLRRGALGTVHVTNSGHTTWHGFAVEIARYLGASNPITPTTSERIQRPAARPKYSVLSGARFHALTGESLRPWEEAVHHYLASRKAIAGEPA